MLQAYKQLEDMCSSEIVLSSTSNIVTIDVCSETHIAFTVHYDGSGILWDLKSGNPTHMLPPGTFSGKVWPAFNDDGSQLAIATGTKKIGKSEIFVYINSFSKNFSIDVESSVTGLEYLKNSPIPHLCVYINNGINTFVDLFSINERPVLLERRLAKIPSKPLHMIKGDYSINMPPTHPSLVRPDITIKKVKNCQPAYLCLQAIKDAKTPTDLYIIERSPSFKQTTEYEKKVLQAEIDEKFYR